MTRSARVSDPAGVPDRQVSGVHHRLGPAKRFRSRRSLRMTETYRSGTRSGSETRAQRASRAEARICGWGIRGDFDRDARSE
jgi:hypothetical protein